VLAELYANPERARELFAPAFQYPDRLSAETIREYLAPFKDVALGRALEKQMLALHAADLMAIEPQLRALEVPTVIAWGTDDRFFPIERAHWLADTIKGAERVVEIPNGKLMWPAERGAELVAVLREHWAAHATATSGV
jgi:pimeloyl-ACP methyl ester carboxylesterase